MRVAFSTSQRISGRVQCAGVEEFVEKAPVTMAVHDTLKEILEIEELEKDTAVTRSVIASTKPLLITGIYLWSVSANLASKRNDDFSITLALKCKPLAHITPPRAMEDLAECCRWKRT